MKGIRFLATGQDQDIAFKDDELLISFGRDRGRNSSSNALRMRFLGTEKDVRVKGNDKLETLSNYYIGNNLDNRLLGVVNYASVKYPQIYPGIDAIVYGTDEGFRYDFRISPGADPRKIKLAFSNSARISIDSNGDLKLLTKGGMLLNRHPMAFQIIDGQHIDIPARFLLLGSKKIGFEVGKYDPNYEITIDPLVYSTYTGGSRDDFIRDVAVDSSGNIYIASVVNSNNFLSNDTPDGIAHHDTRVTKLSADGGTVVYNTLLSGSGFDEPYAIDVDSLGNAYVGGFTDSPNFPLLNARQSNTSAPNGSDGYITKLSSSGSVVFSTYHGSIVDGSDFIEDLKVDTIGNVYVVGKTRGSDFPLVNAFQSTITSHSAAFLSKLSASGSLLYSTFLSAQGSSCDADAGDLSVDNFGNAYITGTTSFSQSVPSFCSDFPLRGGFGTTGWGFVSKVDTTRSGDGSLIYSTRLPDTTTGGGFAIDVDSSGNAYVGEIYDDIGAINSPGSDSKVIKINPAGNAILWQTQPEVGVIDDIVVDSVGEAYYALLKEYPFTDIGKQRGVAVRKLSPGGTLLSSANLNGTAYDAPDGIAFRNGYVYVAGSTNSIDFPVTQNAKQQTNRSSLGTKQQGFLAQLIMGQSENFGKTACQSSVGAPVNVTNGNMYLEQADYVLPSIGESINFTRTYNSLDQTAGIFGLGWSSQYDESLSPFDSFTLTLRNPDGKTVNFRKKTTSTYVPTSGGFFGGITANSDGTYQLTFHDGRIHNFDSGGSLVSTIDRNNNQVILMRDGNGHLASVSDSFGRSVTVQTDTDGKILHIIDSLGPIADYHYDTSGRLDTVTHPDGSQFTFSYLVQTDDLGNARSLLTEVRNALNQIVEKHDYWSDGRAKTSEKANGQEKYTFTYGLRDADLGDYTDVIDANNRESKFYFSEIGTQTIVTRTEGLCGCGSPGSQIVTYSYDNELNLVKKTDALGSQTTYNYDTANVDPMRHGDLLTKTDVYGTETFTYNPLGQVLTYKDRSDSEPGSNSTTATYTYNSSGNVLTVTDRYGFVTTYAYQSTGNQGLPISTTDARGNVTTFSWFPGSGLLKDATDSNNKKISYSYDVRGRLKTITDKLGHITTYNYFDDTQRKVELVYPNQETVVLNFDVRDLPQTFTDERHKVTTYEYDDAYRMKKVTDPLGHFSQYAYDGMSNLTSVTDPMGHVTDYLPDDFNRITKVTFPAAGIGGTRLFEEFSYDKLGRTLTDSDTTGHVTTYSYNDGSRTNTVSRSVNGQTEVSTLVYDKRFRTTSVTDPLNKTYSYTYDTTPDDTNPNLLLPRTTLNRAGLSMSLVYDQVGNLKKRVDFSGRVASYSYDGLDRLTRVTYGPTQVPQQQSVTYGYDDASRLKTASNYVGNVAFGYDDRDRVINTTDVFNHVVEYTYPTINSCTFAFCDATVKLDGSLYATYHFDPAGRLAQLDNAADGASIQFVYDNDDKLALRTYPNSVTTNYGYDGADRITSIADGGGAIAFNRAYTYNDAGQISSITDENGSRQFTYDEGNRLKSVLASNNQNETYNYDSLGNRTSSHLSSTYGYDSSSQAFNRLISTDNGSYSYDSNGNTYQKFDGTLWRYTWDPENRLATASNRKTTITYQYDALGRRVSRLARGQGGITKFTYQGQDVLYEDNDGVVTKYLNGIGMDNKLRMQSGTIIDYLLSDHLGSTTALVDGTGNLVASNSYDSFGNSSNASFPTRYQFSGRESDPLTGLIYNRARSYDPKLGRFISEDPIGLAGGINQFAYVGNNPINATDSTGLYEIDVHYYLTKYLAEQTGCFGKEGSRQIAEGDQQTDENPATSPGFGKEFQNGTFHALNNVAAPGYGSKFLWDLAVKSRSNFQLGVSLHYLQDTFSHEGYPNSNFGHLTGGHTPDKTASDIEKTVTMAKSTFAALSRYAKQQCFCQSDPWNQHLEDTVRTFAAVNTLHPDEATIEGDVGEGLTVPDWADPVALLYKRLILGLESR